MNECRSAELAVNLRCQRQWIRATPRHRLSPSRDQTLTDPVVDARCPAAPPHPGCQASAVLPRPDADRQSEHPRSGRGCGRSGILAFCNGIRGGSGPVVPSAGVGVVVVGRRCRLKPRSGAARPTARWDCANCSELRVDRMGRTLVPSAGRVAPPGSAVPRRSAPTVLPQRRRDRRPWRRRRCPRRPVQW